MNACHWVPGLLLAEGGALSLEMLTLLSRGVNIFFVFCFGACVGSFLNVVIYRLPAGISVISPPSRCPVCGARLKLADNLPIIGWLLLRGRCRYCEVRISPQYVLIELLIAVLFVGLFIELYLIAPGDSGLATLGQSWWYRQGFLSLSPALKGTWPLFILFAFLVAALVAMMIIDARTFLIPIEIPATIIVMAFMLYPLQTLLPRTWADPAEWPIPMPGWLGVGVGLGGMAGVLIGMVLLKAGMLRHSFADYDQYVSEGEVLGDYPHARREVLREVLFLMPSIVLMIAGGVLLSWVGGEGSPSLMMQALGAVSIGYLVGGGLVWGVRILGTLGFGREAMGLGDVHLMAAVGAVLGWRDATFIFFAAAFLGIGWHILRVLLGRVVKGLRRELPYGPHLAMATLLVIYFRPWLEPLWAFIRHQYAM